MSENIIDVKELIKKQSDVLATYVRYGEKIHPIHVEQMLRETHDLYQKVMKR